MRDDSRHISIAIATTGRADWGLLSPLATALRDSGRAEVRILAGNMHFSPELGNTYREIEADGFSIDTRVPPSENALSTAADALGGFGRRLERLKPDCLILLGDRYETLAIAIAASILRIPIVHIAGGAISEGAFDDAFRHAITKLSTLHLTETDDYRRRVIQMGEQPESVVTTGAIGLHILNNLGHTLLTQEELCRELNFEIDSNTLIATLHPATLEQMAPEEQMRQFLAALDSVPDRRIVITYPNNDTDPRPLIAQINEYASRNPGRVLAIPSLGRRRYVSALRCAEAVVGNSSSGIVEVPSAGIPTLDIGMRQRGRAAGPSVIHCGGSTLEIVEGLEIALSNSTKEIASRRENPYAHPDTLRVMKDSILNFDYASAQPKRFYDLVLTI